MGRSPLPWAIKQVLMGQQWRWVCCVCSVEASAAVCDCDDVDNVCGGGVFAAAAVAGTGNVVLVLTSSGTTWSLLEIYEAWPDFVPPGGAARSGNGKVYSAWSCRSEDVWDMRFVD